MDGGTRTVQELRSGWDVVVVEREDRLSSLPDSLLVEILSLLPMDNAAATSVLSRRWLHLWTQVSSVCLDQERYNRHFRRQRHPPKFYTDIDDVIRRLTSPKVRSFRICFPSEPDEEDYQLQQLCYSCIGSWFSFVCTRRVEEMDIFMSQVGCGPSILLPACIFQCSSLSSLKIDGGFYCKLPDNGGTFCLPNLKKLYLSSLGSVWHQPWMGDLGELLKSCPVLEVLELSLDNIGDETVIEITCPNLEYMMIGLCGQMGNADFLIDTPNLKHFCVNDPSFSLYQFVNCPTGLLDAEIHVGVVDDKDDNLTRTLKLFQGICNVRSLDICHGALSDVYYRLGDDSPPLFVNLTHLTIEHCKDFLIYLLLSPNLEEVYLSSWLQRFSIMLDYIPTPLCLLSKLKRIELQGLDGKLCELMQLSYILTRAKVLELLDLSIRDSPFNREARLVKALDYCKALFKLPRASEACEIVFKTSYLVASSKSFMEGSLDFRIHHLQ